MPKLTTTCELIARLKPEDAAAIAALIDMKTEDDVDKVLNKLDTIQTNINARLDFLGKSVDARFDAVNQKISVLYWLIGLAVPAAIAIAKLL